MYGQYSARLSRYYGAPFDVDEGCLYQITATVTFVSSAFGRTGAGGRYCGPQSKRGN